MNYIKKSWIRDLPFKTAQFRYVTIAIRISMIRQTSGELHASVARFYFGAPFISIKVSA
jgi:hypothetical protein